jgi:23S rRNA (uracil1939-C5)-methyltransferase
MLDKPDVVIMDPPRSGMGNPFMSKLAAMNPKRCVYISCNPATQAEGLKLMKVHGYRIEKIVPVDLFPFTKHIENIVVVSR